MKLEKIKPILFGVVAGVVVIFVAMISERGPKEWINAHSMKWTVFLWDFVAILVGGLVWAYAAQYQEGRWKEEEHRKQLEATIQQAQQLEQENLQLCDELDQLQVQGAGDPEQLAQAKSAADRLQKENRDLLQQLRELESENAAALKRFQEDNVRLQEQLRSLESSHEENQRLVASVLKQVAELEQVNEDLTRQVQERPTVSSDSNSAELASARSRMSQLEETNQSLKESLATVETKYRQNEERLLQALAQVSELEQQNANLYHRISEMEVHNSGDSTRISAAMNVVRQLEQENAALHEQVQSLEATSAENQQHFQRTLAQLDQTNRDLQAQIDALKTTAVASKTHIEQETRKVSEDSFSQFQSQFEAQKRQMDAMAHALQYHRAELAQLRQEIRAIVPEGAPVSRSFGNAQGSFGTPTGNGSYATNGNGNGHSANGNGNGNGHRLTEAPIAALEPPMPRPTAPPPPAEDDVYLALLRSRLELEEKMRKRHTEPS